MIDNTMEDQALARVAERMEGARDDAAQLWQEIRGDFATRGPLTAIILKMREDATNALASLCLCDPNSPAEISALQNEVQRLLKTIEIIHGYRDQAVSEQVNTENDLSDDEREYISRIEDD